MDGKFYNKLSKDQKNIIDDAARTAILAGRGLSRIIDSSDKGLPALQKNMEVYVPNPSEMRQFRDATIPKPERLSKVSIKKTVNTGLINS